MGPSASVARSSAEAIEAGSRTSAAKPLAGIALAAERRGEAVDALLAAGDQRDGEALGAEAAGDGGAEALAGTDDGERGHGRALPRGGAACTGGRAAWRTRRG